jgi:transposase-like protein
MSVEGERAYKRYSKEFKLAAVRRMETCGNIAALAAELGVARRFLYKWRDQLRTLGEEALDRGPGEGRRRSKLSTAVTKTRRMATKKIPNRLEKRIAELERRLGVKQMELDFFKRTFEHVRGAMQNPVGAGDKPCIKESKPRSHSKEKD